MPDRRTRRRPISLGGIRSSFTTFPHPRIRAVNTENSIRSCLVAPCSDAGSTHTSATDFSRRDSKFLHDLPASADPCGEYGEFHTVVLGGPMFRCRIDAHVGDRFLSKGFAFADVRLKLKSVSP